LIIIWLKEVTKNCGLVLLDKACACYNYINLIIVTKVSDDKALPLSFIFIYKMIDNLQNEILIEQHKREKEESVRFKDRRFNQWNENYTLFRDKVLINRLTQRQSVNLPIIRETIQSWISKIDEPPILKFESRDRSAPAKDGEIILNELWSYYFDKLKLDILDNQKRSSVSTFKFSSRWNFSAWKIELHLDCCSRNWKYVFSVQSNCKRHHKNYA
jgi:hypothetical protein